MKALADTPLSILDLVLYNESSPIAEAFRNTQDLAQRAEAWGYHRYWMAEHQNIEGIASAATSVLIGYVAESTKRIRVGAGGIMLPNHAPLIVAEHFGTLATLYPGRIDLGLGRAPGGDRGLLESALFRPQSGYYENLFEQAAALMESLCNNHPFVDGNKRIAWTVTKTFLLVNGQHLVVSADEAENFLIKKVIEQKVDLSFVRNWIRERCKTL